MYLQMKLDLVLLLGLVACAPVADADALLLRRPIGKRDAEPEPVRRLAFHKRDAEPEPVRRLAFKRDAEAEPIIYPRP